MSDSELTIGFHDEEFEQLLPHLARSADNRLVAAKNSFKLFIYLYLSHYITIPPGDFQVESYGLAKEPRLLLIWPRGYGKSRTWGVMYPLWVILNNPYDLDLRRQEEILVIISQAGDLPEEWIELQKKELTENPRILADYRPEKGEKWRVDQIDVTSRVGSGTIISKGSGGQIRGYHPTEVLIDDLEDREAAESPGLRKKLRRYFWRDLWGTLRHTGPVKTRFKMIGTPVHEEGLLPQLYQKDHWTKRWFGARKPDGQPLWPQYADNDALIALEKEMEDEPGAFATEILCQPSSREDVIFVKEWLPTYRESDERFKEDMRSGLYTGIFCDPAISRRDRADWTALITISATSHIRPARYYVRGSGCTRHRAEIPFTIDRISQIYQQFMAALVGFEVNGFQEVIADDWQRYCKAHHFHPKLVEYTVIRDKESRARRVLGFFSRHQVYFDTSHPIVQKLVDELLVFPRGEHDDLVDALVCGMLYFANWERRGIQKTRRKPVIMWKPQTPQIYGEVARYG